MEQIAGYTAADVMLMRAELVRLKGIVAGVREVMTEDENVGACVELMFAEPLREAEYLVRRYRAALHQIRALEFENTAPGNRINIFSGPAVFIRARTIAHVALGGDAQAVDITDQQTAADLVSKAAEFLQ